MLSLHALTVNDMENPVGIDEAPRFSWTLKSDRRDTYQQKYQLQIAAEPAFTAPLWDSGLVESGESVDVAAPGLTLHSAAAYVWRVRATDSHGDASPWSAAGTFVTGLLSAAEWKAGFITAEKESDAASDLGTYVRTDFQLQKPVRRAVLFATALGLYRPYINGEPVGCDELAPGWTSYHHQLLYQTYDVTGLLRAGGNAMGAMLGAGWYKGRMGFVSNRNHYGAHSAYLCQLRVTYTDGTREDIVTDDQWQGAVSPVLFANIYDGETYDARLEIDGWCAPGGGRDDRWHAVKTVEHDMHTLRAQGGVRVRAREVFTPTLLTTPKGETVLDFGQNMAGRVEVEAEGQAGDVISWTCFEVLDKDGNVYLDNLRTAKQTIAYTCKGGKAAYHPLFTFQGFRYAKINQFPGTVRADCFRAAAVYSDMPETGAFSCSDPTVNQLQHNILWGMKSNFLDIPTDCPQRDERLGWTGDAQIFCGTASFLMNTHVFFAKWLRDLASDQTAEGGVAHVVPDIIIRKPGPGETDVEENHSAAAWADASVIVPWTVYLVFGDTEILARQYNSMKRWIAFMRDHSENGIWNFQKQFGDWVALDAAEGSYFGATPADLTNTAYYAYSTELFARIARLLHREADAAEYEALHREVVNTFRDTFFDADGSMTVQTQTAHILALQFGLAAPKHRKKTAKRLTELLEQENGHLVTGFLGTPYFCGVLSNNGYLDKAYRLFLKEDYPSWLYQVKKNATTVWEHWDGVKPDGSMWSPNMNSFNHYAYGAVGEWLYTVVCGIQPDPECGGYRRFYLKPHPGGPWTHAGASYQSRYGLIESKWERMDGGVRYTFTVPANTTATVCLYGAAEVARADGLSFLRTEQGMEAVAGSGAYTVDYRM